MDVVVNLYVDSPMEGDLIKDLMETVTKRNCGEKVKDLYRQEI